MAKKSTIHHFPVGNGDMTLLKIASNDTFYTVLTDMHIRQNSQTDTDKCDALKELHNLLELDSNGHPYVDVLILTHPDEDHILGFKTHFHTGMPSEYKKLNDGEIGKILVKEMWSSPIVFRRKSKNHSLCEDAIAFNTEAKRRVKCYRDNRTIGQEGDRIRLIGKDSDGKTDDIMQIVYQIGNTISTVNEVYIPELEAFVLAPLDDDEFPEKSNPDKNRSSIVMQWAIASHGYTSYSNYILLGGDAGVDVWDVLWDKHKYSVNKLQYDILLSPHHCSWHTLSHDSFSDCDNSKPSEKAISALSESRIGAVILSSSDLIKNDGSDPPNYQAMVEYKKILTSVDGTFKCLAEHRPNKGKAPEVLSYRLTNNGPQLDTNSNNSNNSKVASAGIISSVTSGEPIGHG